MSAKSRCSLYMVSADPNPHQLDTYLANLNRPSIRHTPAPSNRRRSRPGPARHINSELGTGPPPARRLGACKIPLSWRMQGYHRQVGKDIKLNAVSHDSQFDPALPLPGCVARLCSTWHGCQVVQHPSTCGVAVHNDCSGPVNLAPTNLYTKRWYSHNTFPI